MAQYFGYELAGVMLVNDGGELPILGLGGSHADIVRGELAHEDFLAQDGITGRVFQYRRNVLVNDTAQDKLYKSLRSRNAGSEICVA